MFSVLVSRWLLVGLGVLVSLAVGAAVAGVLPIGPRSGAGSRAGVAQARLMVDHRRAVVADVTAVADTLGNQAALLTDLMAGDAQRDSVAALAGIRREDLGMQRMQLTELVALGQLAERATKAAATVARRYVVNVWAARPLPVITIDVTGPSGPAAARVARATRLALLRLVRARAPSPSRRLVLRPLGGVRAQDVQPSRRSPLYGVLAAILLFVFWCCGVIVLTGLQRRWRAAGARLSGAAATAMVDR